ncbi:DUF7619 domain-containing protein [Flavobacterium wongokense]|uniref:DUF7619 domain-containing protein n=1 Tax=Flavobacterium wongokense TaxID=2910674 RepID=UPI001F444AE1|nr:T9SS type A sorting domain-containing protein [Flavobacterium sp. WG47]MCF6131191.1 T9SS type A sorting domain-containing protein [Flavobacterium sp. WG47]
MKKTLLLCGFLFFAQFSKAQIVSFPDPGFKAALLYVSPSIDTNFDGEIQVSEATAVTSIVIQYGDYSDATGINSFTNLQSLTISSSPTLTALDVTGLTHLTMLDCSMNSHLQTLNVSGLTNLQNLIASSCHNLTTINTATNTGLLNFICENSSFVNLDLTANTNLLAITVANSYSLTGINLIGLANLTSLNCANCYNLTTLTLAGLTNLQTLDCSFNYDIANLNLSGLNNLVSLDCHMCHSIMSLDISNLPSLQNVNCSNDYITTLNTTGSNNIKNLNCSGNFLSSLSVVHMANLETLDCSNQNNSSGSGIASLDLTGLTHLTSLNCGSNLLTSLSVNHLINLTVLNCGYNDIPSLDISNLTQLTMLSCNGNELAVLDVTPLTALTYLDFSVNHISSINLTPLTNLTRLNVTNNPLGTLDVSALNNLTDLFCSNNNLGTLDVSNLVNLTTLECGSNHLTEIDLQNLTNLQSFRGSSNLFTEIDLSHAATTTPQTFNLNNFDLSYNPNLVHLNLKNGRTNYFFFYVNNCPQLRYICANEDEIQFIVSRLQSFDDDFNTTLSSNVQVNSYCSFEPTGLHNEITGNINYDLTGNGCGAGDIAMRDVKLFINDGVETGAAFTNTTGDYTFFTQQGNFVITPYFPNPYFSISPTSATVNFADDNNNSQAQNFCLTALGVHNDLDVLIIPHGFPRPGFDFTIEVIYKNKGNQILSGNVNFQFDDAVLDFVSATPVMTSQSLNNLSWDFTNLNPFETRRITFVLNVNSPTESPAVNIHDILNFTAAVSPTANDETPEDNTFSTSTEVFGSFDPNDKICLEGNHITPAMVGGYLNYVIRFQNSGTAAAENIVVKDILDPAKFDINSLQLTSSSHPHTTRISGNKVEFIFEHINLPAEIDDEPGSHGYVAFKVKTKNNLVLGNTIENTADIYFDFNFPIVTNTTSTTVALLGASEFDANSVALTPVPVVSILHIEAKETITKVELFDIQGRLLQGKTAEAVNTTLDFSGKSKGVYLVKVYTERGMKVQKVIKQ